MNKAVFLDRDGTLVLDPYPVAKSGPNYLYEPEKVVPFTGAKEALDKLRDAGFLLIVVTNQSGINKKIFDELDLWATNRQMETFLGKFDAIYYCPHTPEERCGCRKPEPDMILAAARKYDIDLKKSYMIGDRDTDLEAGNRAGCRFSFKTCGFDLPEKVEMILSLDK